MTAPARMLTPAELRKRINNHPLRLSDIPLESYVSLPLPTVRWHSSAYAVWIAPRSQRVGQAPLIGAPERWWVLGANNARTHVYALWVAIPFAPDLPRTSVSVAVPQRSGREQRERLASIENALLPLAEAFFVGTPVGRDYRIGFLDLFADYVPGELTRWYRALTPDFFAWLEA